MIMEIYGTLILLERNISADEVDIMVFNLFLIFLQRQRLLREDEKHGPKPLHVKSV